MLLFNILIALIVKWKEIYFFLLLTETRSQSRSWSGNSRICHPRHRHQHLNGENVSILFQQNTLINGNPPISTNDGRVVDKYTPWSLDTYSWAGSTELPSVGERNILRALEVAEMFGVEGVTLYCETVMKCIPCPLIMLEVTMKVLKMHYPERLSSSPNTANSTSTVQMDPCSSSYHHILGPYQGNIEFFWNSLPWHQAYGLQQMPPSQMVEGNLATSIHPIKGLLEQMINKIHSL